MEEISTVGIDLRSRSGRLAPALPADVEVFCHPASFGMEWCERQPDPATGPSN